MIPAKSRSSKNPVAVVAGADLNGLGVLRSLHRAGVPVIALDTHLDKETLWTRYGQKLKIGALAGPTFVRELLDLRRAFDEKPVLFLTQEASVATASDAYERLSEAYHFSLPDRKTLMTLLDKNLFQSEAEKRGFPVPRALRMTVASDNMDRYDLRFPCVLKPATKDTEYGKRFAKAYRVDSIHEAIAIWQQIRNVIDDAILQEWIEGGDSDVYFCLQYRARKTDSRVSFVGRKLLQWPPLVGGTASCIPAPEASDELVALTDAFFEAVGFVGIGSMEFKRDRRDGKFYMVEPTAGRTDYQEEVATLNGVNIPLASYCGELGMHVPESRPVRPARAWRDPIASYRARQSGADDPLLRKWRDLKICDAYFRLADPGPFIHMKLQSVKRRFAKVRFGV